ncbi:Transposon Tf2-6 polyprotein [Aduncisulcus paluster]|uniref:Transposon Tf2-6 polyprotein n=1 Tax=Aduncisulcus paluster TaxID=2918883 RepID=A0ABQ5KJM9_9EUKA|nr:Transposon Tf2-6 polyprotein [Aduncisulcus paluster]
MTKTPNNKTIITTEKGPDPPFLKGLSTENWSHFVREYKHYQSLGGVKPWPELVDSVILTVISDLSKIKDFKNKQARKEAFEKVDAVFASTSVINLYDRLRKVAMDKKLNIDSLLAYTEKFRAIRDRSPSLGSVEDVTDIFIDGLHKKRLRDCVRAKCDEKTTLSEVISIATSETTRLHALKLENAALDEDESSSGEKTASSETHCQYCGKKGHTAKECRFIGGKRRYSSSSAHTPQKLFKKKQRWIKSRDPKYSRFYPDVICRKCDKKGHYAKFCKEPISSKGSGKYFIKVFSTSGFSPFRRSIEVMNTLSGKVVPTTCLLDSGTSSSTISRRLSTELGLVINSEDIHSFEMADGSVGTTLGSTSATIIVQGPEKKKLEVEENFIVIEMRENCSHEVLLSGNCIRKHELISWDQISQGEDESSTLDADLEDNVMGFPQMRYQPIEIHCDIDELKAPIEKILEDYEKEIDRNMPANVPDYSIKLKENTPVRRKLRPPPFGLEEELGEKIEDLLKDGFIVESKSSYAAPIVVVEKPDKSIRMCIDYTGLNSKIVDDVYPIPLRSVLFRSLQGMKLFATLDLKNGYYHVRVDKDSRHLTAFISHKGLFEWVRMPFGLKTAPSHFQRCVNSLFHDIIGSKILIYLDDILVFGKSEEEFISNLSEVLRRLAESNLCLNYDKCKFCLKEVKYLGFTINGEGRRVTEKRIEDMREIPPPKNKKGVQKLLGAINFVSEFIVDYSRITEPISRLLRQKTAKIEWGIEQQEAWEKIVLSLESRITLEHPVKDKQFILRTDASTTGIGGILLQNIDGKEKVISLFSKKFTPAESAWSTIEQEGFGVVYGILKNKEFLLGSEFVVETDHKNLLYIFKSEVPKLVRWRLILAPFSFSIRHIKGVDNATADFLSRIPSGNLQLKALQVSETEPQTQDSEHPEVPVKRILEVHERLGHASARATTKELKRIGFTEKNLFKRVNKEIMACISCQKNRVSKKKKFFGRLKSSQAWSTLSIDTVGPVETDEDGFKYFIVIIDDFTRFAIISPTKTASKEESVREIRRLVSLFGCPKSIRTDGGGQFIASEFEDLLKSFGISHIKTIPGDHEANGKVERLNREVRRLLRIYSLENDFLNYHEFCDWCCLAINSREHSVTKQSPFAALFARESFFTSSDKEIDGESEVVEVSTYVKDLKERMHGLHKEITDIDAPQTEEALAVDEFKIGDLVLWKKETIKSKQKSLLAGPFVVKEKQSDFRYVLKKLDGDETFLVPLKRIIPFIPGNHDHDSLIKAAAKDDEEFQVECILRHKFGTKKPIKFKIRWKHYGEEEDSWEDYTTVKDLEALDEYFAKHPNLKKKFIRKEVNAI